MNKITKPLFSIITVVKNDEKNIQKTILSILNQEFKNFEYIIIDGNSKDTTISLINKYKKDINCIISEDDNGIYHAMNKGAKISNGEFIVFVNSGDLLTKKALKIIQNKISWFFFSSTSHVYSSSSKPISEKCLKKPISFYGQTKLIAEKYIIQNFKKEQIPFCIGRIFSTTNKNQKKNYLIPDLKKKIKLSKKKNYFKKSKSL